MSMLGFTNRGFYRLLKHMADGVALPTTFRVALVVTATPPSAATDTLGQLTQIALGNGYDDGGGTPGTVTRDNTGFPTADIVEDDANNRASIKLRDVVWTASGGPIPLGSGPGARYAVLTDANATVGSREVWGWWDLGSARSVVDTQSLPLVDLELRLGSVA